jgi:hypothetical protein
MQGYEKDDRDNKIAWCIYDYASHMGTIEPGLRYMHPNVHLEIESRTYTFNERIKQRKKITEMSVPIQSIIQLADIENRISILHIFTNCSNALS